MTFIILKDFLGSFHKKTFPSFYFLLANVVNRETEKYDVNDRWKLVRRHHSKKNINGGPKQKKKSNRYAKYEGKKQQDSINFERFTQRQVLYEKRVRSQKRNYTSDDK